MAEFPHRRMRRLRRTEALRSIVRETHVRKEDLILPLFVTHGPTVPISSMPGVHRWNLSELMPELERLVSAGLRSVMLFGIPAEKDELGSGAWDPEGPVIQALKQMKSTFGEELVLFADVCLCEYTDHGHCGCLSDGRVDNDTSLSLLARAAVAYADAGADVIAPSDMMDGRIAAVRAGLDEAGHCEVPILAYAAKYASAFYGPFREAAESAPQFGDRRGYQMDPANAREALEEVALDIAEGADMVMVKPAMPYLDIVRTVRERWNLPVAAYQVSGEYAMLKAACANGWLDEDRAVMESIVAIKRAGADLILSYFSHQLVRKL